jgi:Flp pilus assembly protein TadB
MNEIINLAKSNIVFSIVMLILNGIIIMHFLIKLKAKKGRYSREAKGGRANERTLLLSIRRKAIHQIEKIEGDDKYRDIYIKAKDKTRKAGYKNKHAALIYLACKHIVPILIFLIAILTNYQKNILGPILAALVCYTTAELVVYQKKREINKKFTRHVYKVYKYLHNQISSSVTITEAIKTVHQIMEEEDIKMSLIRMAANYELTSDIDLAVQEILNEYDNQEAETLAMAIKQGVATGGDGNLLEQQEELMFNKYMSYIQAETDRRTYICIAAALSFAFIIVLMVSIPMIMEAMSGIEEMFSF